MKYRKVGRVKFLSQLDLLKVVERAVRRAGVSPGFTEGFHPRVRLAFASALPVGAESESEFLDLDVSGDLPADEVGRRVDKALPDGLDVVEARELLLPAATLGSMVAQSRWHLEGEGLQQPLPVEALLNGEMETVVTRRGKRRDVREYLLSLKHDPDQGTLEVEIRITPTGSIKPDDLLQVLKVTGPVKARRDALLTSDGVEPWGQTQ
ncbi:MAG: TIGR03936 family radical SAM-associated protein [Candidatus Xenobia bacterium]